MITSSQSYAHTVVRLHDAVEFAALAAAVIAMPGPSVLFTISRALTFGRRTALLTVVGNEVGLVAQVITVSVGMGALVERSTQVFDALKLEGALYLVYLGIQAIRRRRSLAEAVAGRIEPHSPPAGYPGRRHSRSYEPEVHSLLCRGPAGVHQSVLR